jgi:hypothetical protein
MRDVEIAQDRSVLEFDQAPLPGVFTFFQGEVAPDSLAVLRVLMGSGLAVYQGMASSHAATLRKGIGL